MIPYISSAVFMLVQTAKGITTKESTGGGKFGLWIVSLLGTVYGAWMLYASGWQYILIMALAYAPGAILYALNQKQKGE
jgi:arginine:ornithine antiporter/lysine permease